MAGDARLNREDAERRLASRRKRRLSDLFGDVLPEDDERDPQEPDRRRDEDYLRDRPPHHE